MAATVIFNSALQSGQLVITSSSVVTQATGLIEVVVQYVCRKSALASALEGFYIDAPPPIFPSGSISATALSLGKLFMVAFSSETQHGISRIEARYVGVSSKIVRPFKSFRYSDFSVDEPVYVSLSGNFGQNVATSNPDDILNNDFLRTYPALRVAFSGRLQSVTHTWATLADSVVPAVASEPTQQEAFAEVRLGGSAGFIVNTTDFQGVFGITRTFAEVSPGLLQETESQAIATSADVAQYAATKNGYARGSLGFNFEPITLEQWFARGVRPTVNFQRGTRLEAITPSVYVREIEFIPYVVQKGAVED